MSKLDTFNFEYTTRFMVNSNNDDIEVITWTVPECYKTKGDERSVEDIKHAILKDKILNLENLKSKTLYEAKIFVKFIKNLDQKTYNQLFKLNMLKEVEENK